MTIEESAQALRDAEKGLADAISCPIGPMGVLPAIQKYTYALLTHHKDCERAALEETHGQTT